MKKILLALCGLCASLWAFSYPARAEINVADSIEWQTLDSDLVVRGRISVVTQRKGPGQVIWYDATVQVSETLRGATRPEQHVGMRHLYGPTPEEWRANKTELLLFLVEGKRLAADDAEFARYPYALRAVHGTGESAMELGKSRAYTADFRVLSKDSDILAAVREAGKSRATKSHRIDVPWNTEAMKALWGGSAVWMFVPADAALEKRALEWLSAKSVHEREQGVLALAHFRSDANIARLQPLLMDTDFAEVSGGDRPPMKRYLVRAAVHDVLMKWNVAHKMPLIEEPLKR